MTPSDLERVVGGVQTSAKYGSVDSSLIASIAQAELEKGRSVKDAVKAAKRKLHQVTGAYQPERSSYQAWTAQLVAAHARGDLRAACRVLMARHASTRERLPVLDQFYATVLGDLGPLASVLDLACGLNPLALPWLDLDRSAAYVACDIDRDQAEFLNAFFALVHPAGTASICNLLTEVPAPKAQVTLLLKTIPCLEQLDKNVGTRLLEQVRSPVIVVSYPASSLGGRRKGMVESYAVAFDALTRSRPGRITRFDFPNELVFRIDR